MNTARVCADCGSQLPDAARDGICPKCALGLAVETVPTDSSELPSTATTPATPGRIFGSYQLFERIGEGGMGIVYKARQKHLDRWVAVKMLKSGSLASNSEIKRFRAEAQAAAQLQHPNLVAVHEVGELDGELFFSMDYVEGQNLAQLLGRTPMSAEKAARYVQTIAEAVHFAHEHGIVHRDLKPQNVIIDARNQPKVTDFGLAKQLNLQSDPTLSGQILGTPSYMPPEQAAGCGQDVTALSDVYSLGAILYDLLTARPPFRADTPLETLRQVVDAEPAAPRLLNPKVPVDLETICLKCLRKDPAGRYASALALAEDLSRFLRREPIKARPPSVVGRAWRWYRRNPVIGTLATLVVMLGFLQGLAAHLLQQTLRERGQYQAELDAAYLAVQLNELADRVKQRANSRELRQALNSSSVNRSNEVLKALPAPPDQAAENWVAMTLEGQLIARSPVTHRTVTDRSWREYFRNGLNLTNQTRDAVAFSGVYESLEDNHHKVGITAVVWSEGQAPAPLALLTLMLNTGPAQSWLLRTNQNAVDRRLHEELLGTEIMLLAPADPGDTNYNARPEYLYAVLRPGQISGDRAFGPIDIRPMKRRPDNYWDDLQPNRGRKMVGVADIPGTPYKTVIKFPAPFWPWLLFNLFRALVIVTVMAVSARLAVYFVQSRRRATVT